MIHKFRDPYIRLFADTGEEHDYNITSTFGFGLVKKDSTGYGRILNPGWIDLSLIRQWKSDCCTLHGVTCMRLSNSNFLAVASLNWLVDVNRKCIVPARRGMPYVALSYVWGKSGNFRAVQSNVRQLQKPGALASSVQDCVVPRTIQDAMTVVTHLHEQYLWVDALCIVQDDDSTIQDQLNNMASIYAGSTVTIIAKDGNDSSFGLHGIPYSLPRNLHQDVFKLTDNCEAIVHPWTVNKKPTLWASRGWTFQEEIFSPRKLIFEGNVIRWECSSAIWHEDHDFNTTAECNDPDEERILGAASLFGTQDPNIGQYGQLLGVYNKRQFTYSADALNAFAGIISSLTRAFKGGFFCGLPVMFFDLALLWQPQEAITRRTINADDSSDIIPPSWSWAGWQGEIDTKIWERGLGSSETVSARAAVAVTWYISEHSNGKRELLQNACFPSATANIGNILLCQTDRCFLCIGRQHSRRPRGAFFSLLDKQGTWAGSLRSHNYPPIEEEFLEVIGIPSREGECELVSISQGYVNISETGNNDWIDEWKLSERPDSTESYKFYNVLWIVWENGIAYRRGLGRVLEEVWQQQELDRIELVLG
jgi:hypothetical protein